MRRPPALRTAGSVPDDWQWDTARDEFIRYAQRRALGPSTMSLVRAAEERGIPWLRLNEQSLVQLGHGQRRLAHVDAGHAGAALGHPRVWLEIDEKGFADCGYCDRRFVLIGGPADETAGSDH